MTKEKPDVLDIRHLSCPMTSVHVRLHLDQIPTGSIVEILLRGVETLHNILSLLTTLHHHMLKKEPYAATEQEEYRLIVRKN